jgi:tubulin epsilon
MRETVVIQVGQCGNQIGNQFWKNLLVEHEATPDGDPALSSFFTYGRRDTNATRGGGSSGGSGRGAAVMKARALLIGTMTLQ